MPLSGVGSYSAPAASWNPAVNDTDISATDWNALLADLSTALSTAIFKDGQATTTVRIPFAQGISSTLTTDATSITTGSIITAGGISAQKALWVGGLANIAGAITVTGASTLQSTLTVTGAATLQSTLAVTGAITASGGMVGAVSTAAQTGITSVGTLTALAVSGLATFSGAVRISGSSFAALSNGNGQMYADASLGLVLYGQGSSTDFNILNKGGTAVLSIPDNTTNIIVGPAAGSAFVTTRDASSRLVLAGDTGAASSSGFIIIAGASFAGGPTVLYNAGTASQHEFSVAGGTAQLVVTATGSRHTNIRDDAGNLIISSTNPTIDSGFGTGPSISAANTAAFKVTVGTATVSDNTGVVTMPAAPNGWICSVSKIDGGLTTITKQFATTATSISVFNYTPSTGVGTAWTTGDVLLFQCVAF